MGTIEPEEFKLAVEANYASKLGWLGYTLRRALGLECSDDAEREIATNHLPYAIGDVVRYHEQKHIILKEVLNLI